MFEEQLDENRLQPYVTELEVTDAYNELREQQRKNVTQRRAFIEQWAEYVRTHPDEEWSAQQNKVIDSSNQTITDNSPS